MSSHEGALYRHKFIANKTIFKGDQNYALVV